MTMNMSQSPSHSQHAGKSSVKSKDSANGENEPSEFTVGQEQRENTQELEEKVLQIIDEEKLNELQNKTITEEDNASDENMSDDTLNFLKQLKNEQNAPVTDVIGKTHGNVSVRNGGAYEPIMAFNDVRI